MRIKPNWYLLRPEDVTGAVLSPTLVVTDNEGSTMVLVACLMGDLLVTAELLRGLRSNVSLKLMRNS
jgi:hypothetical protein